MKLDFNRFWFQNLEKETYFYSILKQADLITVESLSLQRMLNETYDIEVNFIRNGFYKSNYNEKSDYRNKENIILTVGRLGTEQKYTELLIESFLKADIPGWKLRLVGSIEKEFQPFVDKIKANIELKDKIQFVGRINDKKKLMEEYKKAKIFCMTSILEGCAHVYVEAGINECYIVSIDVDGIDDMKDFISIIHENNSDRIADEFEILANNQELMEHKAHELYEYTKNECSWDIIVDKLYMLLSEKGMV